MRVQVQRWGNSLALRIPKSFAVELGVEQGTTVELSLVDGKIIVTSACEKEYRLDQLLTGITKKNIHREIKTGRAMGREVW